MINYVIGDATDPQGDGMKLIVHCCNDIGAWGAGFVLALSKKWDEPEQTYRDEPLPLGSVQYVSVEPEIIVANLIGQHGIKEVGGISPVRYDAFYRGFTEIAANKDTLGSVHMPRIGAGLAGGKWSIIEAIINETLVASGMPVTVYDLHTGSALLP